MRPYEELPFFFGHINFAFFECPFATSQRLEFCAHVYGVVTLSPGSSQLSPEELGDIFVNRIGMEIDPAVFSALSFPSWFAFEATTGVPNSASTTRKIISEYVNYSWVFVFVVSLSASLYLLLSCF
jgi:hypothetical protein